MEPLTCPFCDSSDVSRVGQWGGQIITAQWVCHACNSHFEVLREDFDDAPQQRTPARISLRRRIEWMDTDAAGIYHWTTAFRLAEAAEAALHTTLGVEKRTFGATPRLAIEAQFRQPLRFNDIVDVVLAVDTVGRTSVGYVIEIHGPDGLACEGRVTTCLVDKRTGRPEPWPADISDLLQSAGTVTPRD
jgi:acyl-CoA thioesterase FadM